MIYDRLAIMKIKAQLVLQLAGYNLSSGQTLLYCFLVNSHLEYSITAWGNAKCEGWTDYYKKQKKAVRYVADAKYNAYFDPLLENIFEPKWSNRVLNLKVPLPKHKLLKTFLNVSFVK